MSERRRRYLIYGAATALSIALFAAMDFGVAQVCKTACSAVWSMDHVKKFRIADEIYHHGLAPNVTVVDDWGGRHYPLATNSLGFKDATPRDVPLKSDRRRFLFIGDSFTEGQGVPWEESLTGRIADGLAPAGIEVLNAAVSSYAPGIFYSKLRYFIGERGLTVERVFALIDMSDIYDEAYLYNLTEDDRSISQGKDAGRRRAFGKGFSAWVKDNSITAAFIYQLRDYLYYQIGKFRASGTYSQGKPYVDKDLWMAEVGNVRETTWCFDAKEDARWAARGLAAAQKHMLMLRDFLAERGIGLTVAIYPWPSNIVRHDHPSRCAAPWIDWAARQGIDLIDLFGDFIDGGDPWQTLDTYFIPYDVHWNPAGHGKVAERLLKHMRAHGMIGGG